MVMLLINDAGHIMTKQKQCKSINERTKHKNYMTVQITKYQHSTLSANTNGDGKHGF